MFNPRQQQQQQQQTPQQSMQSLPPQYQHYYPPHEQQQGPTPAQLQHMPQNVTVVQQLNNDITCQYTKHHHHQPFHAPVLQQQPVHSQQHDVVLHHHPNQPFHAPVLQQQPVHSQQHDVVLHHHPNQPFHAPVLQQQPVHSQQNSVVQHHHNQPIHDPVSQQQQPVRQLLLFHQLPQHVQLQLQQQHEQQHQQQQLQQQQHHHNHHHHHHHHHHHQITTRTSEHQQQPSRYVSSNVSAFPPSLQQQQHQQQQQQQQPGLSSTQSRPSNNSQIEPVSRQIMLTSKTSLPEQAHKHDAESIPTKKYTDNDSHNNNNPVRTLSHQIEKPVLQESSVKKGRHDDIDSSSDDASSDGDRDLKADDFQGYHSNKSNNASVISTTTTTKQQTASTNINKLSAGAKAFVPKLAHLEPPSFIHSISPEVVLSMQTIAKSLNQNYQGMTDPSADFAQLTQISAAEKMKLKTLAHNFFYPGGYLQPDPKNCPAAHREAMIWRHFVRQNQDIFFDWVWMITPDVIFGKSSPIMLAIILGKHVEYKYDGQVWTLKKIRRSFSKNIYHPLLEPFHKMKPQHRIEHYPNLIPIEVSQVVVRKPPFSFMPASNSLEERWGILDEPARNIILNFFAKHGITYLHALFGWCANTNDSPNHHQSVVEVVKSDEQSAVSVAVKSDEQSVVKVIKSDEQSAVEVVKPEYQNLMNVKPDKRAKAFEKLRPDLFISTVGPGIVTAMQQLAAQIYNKRGHHGIVAAFSSGSTTSTSATTTTENAQKCLLPDGYLHLPSDSPLRADVLFWRRFVQSNQNIFFKWVWMITPDIIFGHAAPHSLRSMLLSLDSNKTTQLRYEEMKVTVKQVQERVSGIHHPKLLVENDDVMLIPVEVVQVILRNLPGQSSSPYDLAERWGNLSAETRTVILNFFHRLGITYLDALFGSGVTLSS